MTTCLNNKLYLSCSLNIEKNLIDIYMNNNICRNSDSKDKSLFNYDSLLTFPEISLNYTGNPKIYIYGDLKPCDKGKFNNYIYVYFKFIFINCRGSSFALLTTSV
jgi:hypothetical protein